ncbi:ABC transporter permease [Viridibacillus arvi]|uniref:ABC transporter permease n=1 Tax=Viridibacillus arvi TaxID=263475 RepID=UPI003CFCA0BF
MNSLAVLMKKEYSQVLNDFKVIWLPLVFIFLGTTQPIMTYYLPAILKALGGAQGISIDPSMTEQTGGQVLAATLGSQFDQLGIMIIVIAMMGLIQSDKSSGMLAFILTRPVTVSSYIGGKLLSNYLLVSISVGIGYVASLLYIHFLFTGIELTLMITALFCYLLWILFCLSFTTMLSAVLNSQALIALIGIITLLICRMLVGLHPVLDVINPAGMSKHAMNLLITGLVGANFSINFFATIFWVILTVMFTYHWIVKKKFQPK